MSETHSESRRLRSDDWLAGGGETGALIRSIDWSGTPLGAESDWPQSLRTALSIAMSSRFPITLYWGAEFLMLYNDDLLPMVGANKHPWAMGRPAFEVLPEIRQLIEPLLQKVVNTGEAIWSEDMMLPLQRGEAPEEGYFTFTYSPVRDESGGVGGVFCAVLETTDKVIEGRRLRLLNALANATEAKTPAEACAVAAAQVAQAQTDVPFALIYLVDESAAVTRLAGTANIEAGHALAPPTIALGDDSIWPLELAAPGGPARVVPLKSGPGGARGAVILPIERAGGGRPLGFIVAGLSALLRSSDSYERFHNLLAASVAQAVSNAAAYEGERKRAEALAEIDRAKTTFFSNVSHEFRTPLTLMLGPTEDLLAGAHGELSTDQRTQLELLRRNELRLQRLVNALLEFSRIEAGRVQATFEPIDLSSLTLDLASAFRSAVERAGIKFTVDCPPLDESIFVDRDMWEQIVLNLLSNAFKFTFEGEIAVSLHAEDRDVVLQVNDTGVGVRPEEVSRLFERFHRIEGTRARTHEGSGIGLALVKELARLHGGAITARSTYGVGTSFRVTIPRGSAHLPAERLGRKRSGASDVASSFVEEALSWLPESHASSRPAAGAHAALASIDRGAADDVPARRILVADDNADMRAYLQRILSERWAVETVADGEAALRAAKESRPDLILTDAMMPILDGFKLIKALRDDLVTKDIPVIMVSARAGEESRVEGLQAGADDFLIKPFSARELVARVAANIDASELRQILDAERAKLKTLFEGAPAAICVLKGPAHVYELANPLYLRVVGRRKLLGQPIRTALPELEGQCYFEILDEVYRTGKTYFGNESRAMLDLSGEGLLEERFFNFIYAPRRDGKGDVDGILVFAFDVTDQVVARQRIEEERGVAEAAQRKAESTLRVRDEFFTIASHELRTPLTTLGLQIDGFISSLGALSPDQGRERALVRAEKLRTQADRLEQLVASMLDAFGLDAVHLELKREELELGSLIRAVVERLRRDSQKASAAIRVRGEPLQGRWDRERLEQILSHLLTNAIKFGQGKPIDVTLEGTDDAARIAVTDHGIGIAKADQERVFERFERASPVHEYGGFGLGLWIVRELVRAMGGTVRVTSHPDDGTTFTVTLPRSSGAA